jgi:hypothetical protein
MIPDAADLHKGEDPRDRPLFNAARRHAEDEIDEAEKGDGPNFRK